MPKKSKRIAYGSDRIVLKPFENSFSRKKNTETRQQQRKDKMYLCRILQIKSNYPRNEIGHKHKKNAKWTRVNKNKNKTRRKKETNENSAF